MLSYAISKFVTYSLPHFQSRVWEPLPALIFGVLSIASGFSVLVLPETLGESLFETMEEAETFNP